MSRVRYRCFEISGERDGHPFTARVQGVDGEELSPESTKALLGICGAAAELLRRNDTRVTPKRRRKGEKRLAEQARRKVAR